MKCVSATSMNYSFSWVVRTLVAERTQEDITRDFIEGLPLTNDKSAIFVVVDQFTKLVHFVTTKHPFTASTVAQVFL